MSANIVIYHNGECSKCRGALEILQEKNIPYQVRWYMADPLSEAELADLVTKLGIKPSELVRTNEEIYKQLFEGKSISEGEWIKILAQHSALIQRPIVVKGDEAIIARPPERVFEIL